MFTKAEVVKAIKDATRSLERKRSLNIPQAVLIGRLRRTLETVRALPGWKVKSLRERKKKTEAGVSLTDIFNPAVTEPKEPEIVIEERKPKKAKKKTADILSKTEGDFIRQRVNQDRPRRGRRRRPSRDNPSRPETLHEALTHLMDAAIDTRKDT